MPPGRGCFPRASRPRRRRDQASIDIIKGNVIDMAVAAAQNILDLFAGRWPTASLINPDVKATWKP